MGSIAIGIPIGALLATSPLETSAFFYAWSFDEDAIDVYRDREVIGRLQVRWMVLLPLFFSFFSLFLKNYFFLCFS